MPSWGVGIFRKSEGGYITVEFENAGIKKFSMSSISTMLKIVGEPAPQKQTAPHTSNAYVPVNAQNGSLIQYDGEAGGIAGKNVIEAFEGKVLSLRLAL